MGQKLGEKADGDVRRSFHLGLICGDEGVVIVMEKICSLLALPDNSREETIALEISRILEENTELKTHRASGLFSNLAVHDIGLDEVVSSTLEQIGLLQEALETERRINLNAKA